MSTKDLVGSLEAIFGKTTFVPHNDWRARLAPLGKCLYLKAWAPTRLVFWLVQVERTPGTMNVSLEDITPVAWVEGDPEKWQADMLRIGKALAAELDDA